MSEGLLSVRQMRAGYGDAVVLDDIWLDVPEHGSLAGSVGMGNFNADLLEHKRFTLPDSV